MQRHRTGGMIVLAVLTIVFGGLCIFSGVAHVLRSLTLIYELWRLGVLDFRSASPAAGLLALLILATGIVGLIAGIGIFALRPWARTLSLVYSGLFIFSSAASFTVAIVTYPSAYAGARLIIFSAAYVAIPVLYSLILYMAFHKSAWKATFVKIKVKV